MLTSDSMSFVFHARRGVLRKALQLGQSLPRAHCYMVLEDDVWADDAVLVREIMTEAQRAMVKDWVVLQLGSRNCGRAPQRLTALAFMGDLYVFPIWMLSGWNFADRSSCCA